MKFLIDAQLPPALAEQLKNLGHDADHVVDMGWGSAADQDIWNRAAETGAVLISKDEDFALMRILDPTGPPLIWIRVGNTTRRELLKKFALAFNELIAAIERGESLVELAE